MAVYGQSSSIESWGKKDEVRDQGHTTNLSYCRRGRLPSVVKNWLVQGGPLSNEFLSKWWSWELVVNQFGRFVDKLLAQYW